MAVTRDEVEAMQKRFDARRVEADTKRGTMLQQAVVSAEHMTGDSDWDKYLTFIQAKIEDAQKTVDAHKDTIMLSVDDPAIRTCQLKHAYARGLLDAFVEARNLPKTLKEESKIIKP